jgi:hypothetical protein
MAATLQLTVDLDTTANPAVIISNRNPQAEAGAKIKWLKKTGAADFNINSFDPQSTPFDNVSVTATKIECDFNPPSGDPEGTDYPYTITVTYDGNTYSSDKLEGPEPTGDRAVIRN